MADGIPKNSSIHNPYCSSNLANQIGEKISVEENNIMWSDVSDFLLKCNYVQAKHIGASRDTGLKVFSINVRSLTKYRSKHINYRRKYS